MATTKGSAPWPMVKLGEVAEIISGGTPKTSVSDLWDGEIPWVTPADMDSQRILEIEHGARNLTHKGLSASSAVLLPAGAVVMSSRAPIGHIGIAKKPLATNQGCKSFVCSDALYPRYLAHYLFSIREQLQMMGSGATFKELSKSRAKEIPIPLPPLDGQRRIAEILDSAKKLVDQQGMLLRKMVKDLNMAVLAFAEQSARTVKLADIATVATGATPSRKNPDFYGGDIPWVKTDSVNGKVIERTEELITQTGLENSNCKIFREGTILIAMYGQGKTRGQVGLLGLPAATNQACAAVIPKDREDDLYIFRMLDSKYEELRSLGRGGTQPNLNLSLVRNFEIPYPNKRVRETISANLSHVDGLVRLQNARFQGLRELHKSLSTRAFQGEP